MNSMINDVHFKPKEEIQSLVGKNIRNTCKDKNVKIMEFSEEIGMSYEYLRHIVSPNGKKSLSFYSLYKIAKALGVSMDELCEGIFDEKK